jgi:hypothetical protein
VNIDTGTITFLKFAAFGTASATQASAAIDLPPTAKKIMVSLAVDSITPVDAKPNVALTVFLGTGNSFSVSATNLSMQTVISNLVVRWWAILA